MEPGHQAELCSDITASKVQFNTKVYSILCVKTGVINEIETTSYNISSCKGGTILFAIPR